MNEIKIQAEVLPSGDRKKIILLVSSDEPIPSQNFIESVEKYLALLKSTLDAAKSKGKIISLSDR